jgi:HEAT repeat protein
MRPSVLTALVITVSAAALIAPQQGRAQSGYEPYRIASFLIGDVATSTRVQMESVGGANVRMSAEGPGYTLEFVVVARGPARVNFNGPGAFHEYIGRIVMPIDDKEYVFVSDAVVPLKFRVEKGVGLVYLSGSGTVTEPGGTRVSFPPRLSLQQWVENLSDSRGYVREGAAGHLGDSPGASSVDSRTVSLLISALKDPEPGVRLTAAQSLGRLGDRQAIPALKRSIEPANEADKEVRVVAEEAIRRLGQ